MVLSAPMIAISERRLGVPRGRCLRRGRFASRLRLRTWRRLRADSTSFEGNPLTSDRERYLRTSRAERAPALGLGSPTVAWLRAAFRSMRQLRTPDYPARAGAAAAVRGRHGHHRLDAGHRGVRAAQGRHARADPRPATRSCRRPSRAQRFWAAFDAYLGVDARSPDPALNPMALDRLRVHARVAGGDDAAALGRRLAVPGRDAPAGALDDRHQRDDVVGLEAGLDDEVDEARRQQAIAVAVAAVAGHARARLQPREARRFGGGANMSGCVVVRIASAEPRAGARLDAVRACRVAARGTPPPGRPEALAGEGLVHQAEHRRRPVQQPDQRAPQRRADDEGAGAVDRIDDPVVAALGRVRAELLADDAVVGEACRTALRMARSAARSAAVTGSKPPTPALLSTASGVRKYGQDRRAGKIRQAVRKLEARRRAMRCGRHSISPAGRKASLSRNGLVLGITRSFAAGMIR